MSSTDERLKALEDKTQTLEKQLTDAKTALQSANDRITTLDSSVSKFHRWFKKLAIFTDAKIVNLQGKKTARIGNRIITDQALIGIIEAEKIGEN